MKKLKFLLWAAAIVAGFTFTACSSDDDDDSNSNNPSSGQQDGPTQPTGNPDNLKFASFSGTVLSEWGGGIGAVTVTTGSETTKTDVNGFFKFDKVSVVSGRAVMKFEKDGYMSVVRSFTLEDNDRMEVVLSSVTDAQFNSSVRMTWEIGYYDAVKVELPNNGYVAADGKAYNGIVTARAVYLDPDDELYANRMPGDLSAVRTDNSPAQLVSYGMVAVELTGANGEKLNLAEGKTATLSFPIPSKFKDNTPATIPLWSFNESTGLWEEEGVATLQGSYYVGEVSHFSWHNLDHPELKATINVTVKDSNGKLLAHVPVDIDGQRMFYTDKNGKMKCDIPSNTDLYVTIPSEAYGNYADNPDGSTGDGKKVNIRLSGGETKDITFTLPCAAPVISGTVTNTGTGSKICSVYIIYNIYEKTKSVMTDLEGAFSVFAPVNYRGSATLVARFANGQTVSKDFTITDNDQRIDLTVSSESVSGTGMFTVTSADGLNVSLPLPAAPDGGLWETVSIIDNMLTVSGQIEKHGDNADNPDQENWEREYFYLSIEGYDPSKTEFDAWFQYMKEAGPHLGLTGSGPVKVTLKDGIYNFKITNGKGQFNDQMNGVEGAEVNVKMEFSAKAQKE